MYMYNRGISDRLCSTSYTISHRPTVCITNLHSAADIITVFFCKLGGISQFFKPQNKAIRTHEGDDVGQASLPSSGPETADSHGTDSGHQDPLKCLQENLPIIPVTFLEEQDVEGILKYRDNTEESYSGIDEDDDEAIGNEILGPCVDVVEPKLQKPPGPSDLSQSPCEEPMQPYLRKYPGHVVGIIELCCRSCTYLFQAALFTRSGCPDEKPIELKRLSDTRWSAQISPVRAVRSRLSVIVALLQQIGDEERGDRAVEARSILNQMDIKFTFCLEIFNDLLREMKSTSDSLQRTQLNVSAACDLINNVRHYLQQKRTPDEFKEHFDAAKQLAESNELQTTIAFKSRSRARLLPRRFEGDMIVTESIDRTEAPPDLATLLLNDIYYPVIDTALSEVERRFGGANRNSMCGIGALTPGSGQFLEYSSIKKVRGAVKVKCRRFSARVETDEAYDRAQNS